MSKTRDIFRAQPLEQRPTGNPESAETKEDRTIKAVGSSPDRIGAVQSAVTKQAVDQRLV